MGLIAKLLSFVRTKADGAHVSDVKIDPGGEANLTAQHFACPGDDSHPLPGDYVASSPSTGSGTEQITGYIDPANAGQAGPGEKRIYSRDSSGTVVAVVWLRDDGTIEIGLDPTDAAAVASIVDARLDALESKLNGLITKYNTHVHPATMGSTSPTATQETGLSPGSSTASATVKVQP